MYSVLYVDDEKGLLEIGKLFLEETGDFRIETTESACNGLELLKTSYFDAIISDYQMPEMDGIHFLKKVRSEFGEIPFILFTGKGREEVVIQAINNGADFYLQKGGEPQSQFAELGHKIQQAVQRKRAEDALRINEERLSMAQAIGGIGSWELDPVTGRVWGSHEAFRIFGLTRPDDGTATLDEIGACIPERARVRSALDNLLNTGADYNLEYQIIPADNSGSKILKSVARLKRDASGTIIKVSGVIQDVTDHKKSEEQILKERENFYKILSTAPVGLILIDTEGVITQANQYFSSIVYRDPAEIIGKRAGSAVGCVHSNEDTRGCGFSDSCPECPLRSGIDKVLHEKTSINGALIDLTLLIDGRPQQRWLSVSAEPLELANRMYTIVSVDDITAQMEYEEERIRKSDELNAAYEQIAAAEEEIRQNYNEIISSQRLLLESRQYLQSIIQGSPIPTFVIDKDHRITSWNRALTDYLGISSELVVGKPLAGLAFYKKNRPSLADLIVDQAFDEIEKWYEGKAVLSSGIEGAYEVTDFFPLMKGGTWLFFTASPIHDDAGNLIGAVETLQDITERKRAEEKLSQTVNELNEAYEELAATEEELRQNLDEIGKSQSELTESENRFRSAMNQLPGTAWTVDRELRYTLSQGAGLTLLGLKPDHVLGMTLYEFFNTSDPSHPVIRHHLRALNGESAIYDYTHEGVSFRTYLSPQYDSEGNITGVAGLAVDITELTRIDEKLKESEEKYRTLVEKANEVIIIAQDGLLVFANPRLSEMLGVPVEMLLGKPFVEYIWPEDREYVLQRYGKRIEGEIVPDAYDFRVTGAGGRPRWVFLSAARIHWQGRPATLNLITDITERKSAEVALKESFEIFKTIMDSLDALVYVADMKTYEILFINKYGSSIWGDITGKTCWNSLQKNQAGPCTFCTNKNLLDEAGNPTGIYTWEFQNSVTRRWYDCRDSAVQWTDGRTVRLEIATDITGRKKTEDALRQANRQLTLLSVITRHDILNKVTVCLANISHAKRKFRDPGLAEYLEKIESAISAIRSQIDFTRVYQDLGTHEPLWQELDGILPREHVPGIITFNADVKDIEVFADIMLGRVFFNLLDNSIRHGKHVTEITVSCRHSDGGITILWEDNGVGIAAPEKEEIFERGFGNNTGLGMFLVREILFLTGILICETGEPGKGVRFEISVPKGMYRKVADSIVAAESR